MKRFFYIFVPIIVVILVVVLFVIRFHATHTKVTTIQAPGTKTSTQIPLKSDTGSIYANFDSNLEVDIQTKMNDQNDGSLDTGYPLNKTNYLVLSQLGDHQYTTNYPSDELNWAIDQNHNVQLSNLSKGQLVHVTMFNNSPFLNLDGNKVFIFNQGVMSKFGVEPLTGYVYEMVNNQPKLIFQTKGVFDKAYLDANLNLFIEEREFDDPTNALPVPLKPYSLVTYEWQNGKFEVVNKQKVTPKYGTK